MALTNKALYEAILALDFDNEDNALRFYDRLARENQWRGNFSQRAIIEYKKFVYLTTITNQSLTPSDQVDQAWHLHLTYSRSYWQDMCRNILKRDLHHGPTKGGKQEQNKYKQQYQFTLDLYTQEFGEVPPDDIWPSVKTRFKHVDKFVRINSSQFWMIKKHYGLIAPIFFVPVLAIASIDETSESDFWFYLKIIFGVYIAYKVIQWIWRNGGGRGNGGGCGTGCSGCGGGCGS